MALVYERVPHITLKAIANNAEIDVIWDKFQEKLEPLREQLNVALGRGVVGAASAAISAESRLKPLLQPWQEWEIPRELPESVRPELVEGHASTGSARTVAEIHQEWWKLRIARQQEIDASIAAKADSEYLYDKPYEDKKKVRVAGPFTVESLSPHRVLTVDENDDLVDGVSEADGEYREERDFVQMILENLKTAGVQQAHKTDKIDFTSLSPWPGELICAEGRYMTPSPLGERAGVRGK